MVKAIFSSILSIMIFTVGCTLSPKYTRPEAPIPQNIVKTDNHKQVAESLLPMETGWKEFFTDPKLQNVIELALKNNRDLRVAVLNIEKAKAFYRIQKSELMPNLVVSGTVNKESGSGRESGASTQYSVGGGFASWELDFFGRIRSLKEAALQQFFASEQARLTTKISLISGVAQSYFSVAASQENLQLANSTVKIQYESYNMLKGSRDLGIASELDLKRAESQLEVAKVNLAMAKGQLEVAQNALNLLVGLELPSSLLPESLSSIKPLMKINAGVSSEILLKRPDILMAESQLKALNANIGAARAAFFPRISLTAAAGYASGELSNLFDSDSKTWGISPEITLPIFFGGANKANLKVAKVNKEIAIAYYEKAIQNAFKEVSDALSFKETFDKQLVAQESLVKAVNEIYVLSKERHKEGIDGYLGVLISQQSLNGSKRGLVQTKLDRFVNFIELYKALGGGIVTENKK